MAYSILDRELATTSDILEVEVVGPLIGMEEIALLERRKSVLGYDLWVFAEEYQDELLALVPNIAEEPYIILPLACGWLSLIRDRAAYDSIIKEFKDEIQGN